MEASDDEFESLLMGFDIPEPTTYHDSLKGKNQSLDPSDRLDAREETASVSTTESRVVDEDLDALMDLMDDDIPDEGEGDQYREGERGEIGEGEEEGEGERGSLDNNNSGHRVVRCTTLATKPSTTQTRSCPPSLSAPTLHKGSTSSEVQTWLHSISMGEVASKFKNKSGAQMLRYKERQLEAVLGVLDGADLFHAIRDTEAEHEADQTGQRNGRSSQLLSSSSTSSLTVNKPQSFSEQMALASTERRILKKKALEELQNAHMKQSSKRYKNVSLLTDASPRDAGDGAQISSSIPIPKKQKVGYTSNSIASKRYSSASQTSSVSKTSSSLSSSTDSDFIEKHSGIRIKNRLISSIDLDNKLRDVPTVKIPNIKNKVDHGRVLGNWVVFGVISKKSEPRTTKKNTKFMILTLTDMRGAEVSVFLFGKAFKAFWKEAEGLLVCVANAKPLPPSREGGGIALSINSEGQLLKIGSAMDLGYCQAFKSHKIKSVKCQAVINIKDGRKYCDYHVRQEYNKIAATRMNLNRNVTSTRNLFGQKGKLGNARSKNLPSSKGTYTIEGQNVSVAGNSRLNAINSRVKSSSKLQSKKLAKIQSQVRSNSRFEKRVALSTQKKLKEKKLAEEKPKTNDEKLRELYATKGRTRNSTKESSSLQVPSSSSTRMKQVHIAQKRSSPTYSSSSSSSSISPSSSLSSSLSTSCLLTKSRYGSKNSRTALLSLSKSTPRLGNHHAKTSQAAGAGSKDGGVTKRARLLQSSSSTKQSSSSTASAPKSKVRIPKKSLSSTSSRHMPSPRNVSPMLGRNWGGAGVNGIVLSGGPGSNGTSSNRDYCGSQHSRRSRDEMRKERERKKRATLNQRDRERALQILRRQGSITTESGETLIAKPDPNDTSGEKGQVRGLSREQSLTANRSRRLSLNRDRNPSRSSLSSSSVSVDVENGIKLNASTLRKRKRGSTEENCQNHTHKQNVQGQKSLTDAQKRIRKAFGTIDMQSQEGQAVLHASSRNEDLIDHNARLERDRLFDLYEKKEHLVEVMEKVTSQTVTAWKCKICKYIAFSISDLCREKKHKVEKVSKAKKRFFECVHCKKRKITLNERFPKTTCGKCGKNEFKAVGMMKMKADKVGSECFNEKIHELTEQY